MVQTSQVRAAKRADFGVKTGTGVSACVSQGMGTGKAQLFAASVTGMGSHNSLVTFECCSRGRGSPPAPQPLPWGDTPGPAGTYWIFLVKFLETIPPSTCCSSCLPGGKRTPHVTTSPGDYFFSPTSNNKTQQEIFRVVVPLPQCKPFSTGRAQGPSPVWGHSTPVFPVRGGGCQELGIKKKAPDVTKLLELAASVLVPLPRLCSLPLHRQAGVPVPGASLKLKPRQRLPGPP